MKKHLATLLSVGTLALMGSAAHAQTFLLTPHSGGAAGSWLVTFSGGSTNWNVTVQAHGTQVPNANGGSLSVVFRKLPQFTGYASTAASGTVGGSPWSATTGTSTLFAKTPTAPVLQASGGNSFTGAITLASAPTVVTGGGDQIEVSLNGFTTGVWKGQRLLSPEAPAAVQFLPALLPVGLILGRRRFLRKKSA